MQVFTESFHVPYEGQVVHVMFRNLNSIKEMEEMIKSNIRKELQGGHILGSHKSPLPNFCISSLRVIPKKASSGWV